MRAYSLDLRQKVVAAVERGDLACGEPANARVYRPASVEPIDGNLEEFRAKGYLFGSNSARLRPGAPPCALYIALMLYGR